MQQRDEDRRIHRSFGISQSPENPAAPIENVAAVASGASQKVGILVHPVAESSGK